MIRGIIKQAISAVKLVSSAVFGAMLDVFLAVTTLSALFVSVLVVVILQAVELVKLQLLDLSVIF